MLDELGLDLHSLAVARKEARVAAAELAKEGNGGPHEITIGITDASGRDLAWDVKRPRRGFATGPFTCFARGANTAGS